MASKFDQGEVSISLNGEIVVLKPSINAWRSISRQYGGMIPASQKLQSFDIDAMVFVIQTGAQLSGDAARNLDRRVYENGIAELLRPLIEYLNLLGNGGRPPSDAGDEGSAEGN